MIDSSVRNLGKLEHDKQNCLQHHKTKSLTEKFEVRITSIANEHKSVHKKISQLKQFGKEHIPASKTLGKSKRMSRTGFNIMLQSYVQLQGGSNGFSVLSHDSQLIAEPGFLDIVGKFKFHIRLPQGFLQ